MLQYFAPFVAAARKSWKRGFAGAMESACYFLQLVRKLIIILKFVRLRKSACNSPKNMPCYVAKAKAIAA